MITLRKSIYLIIIVAFSLTIESKEEIIAVGFTDPHLLEAGNFILKNLTRFNYRFNFFLLNETNFPKSLDAIVITTESLAPALAYSLYNETLCFDLTQSAEPGPGPCPAVTPRLLSLPDSDTIARALRVVLVRAVGVSGVSQSAFFQGEDEKQAALLYDEAATPADILRLAVVGIRVKLHRLRANGTATLRRFLVETRYLGFDVFVLLCSEEETERVLQNALLLGMLNRHNSFFLTSFHPVHFDAKRYAATHARISAFYAEVGEWSEECVDGAAPAHVAALLDALAFVAARRWAETDAQRSVDLTEVIAKTLDEGRVRFDRRPSSPGVYQRIEYTLTLWNLHHDNAMGRCREGFVAVDIQGNVGGWTDAPKDESPSENSHGDLRGRWVRVATVLEPPFVVIRNECMSYRECTSGDEKACENSDGCQGNDAFDGYCVELMKMLSDEIGFEFELYLSPDGHYGNRNEDETWNGIIHEVIVGNALLGLAPLTINLEREEVVDFTKPFMQIGTSAILHNPRQPYSIFQFTNPFDTTLWLCIGAAFILVGVVFSALHAIRRYFARKFRSEDDDADFSVADSFWFTTASLLQQGAEELPTCASARLLAAGWWFFALIVVTSYTANLAAFLTVIRMTTEVESIADLLEQTRYSYGCKRGTSTAAFFRDTDSPVYHGMWNAMAERLVESTEEGVRRAVADDFAYISDDKMLQFQATRYCDLHVLTENFNSASYGIAVPNGAAFEEQLSAIVIELGQNGFLNGLEAKWWPRSKCMGKAASESSGERSMGIRNVGGVFVILSATVVGAAVACLVRVVRSGRRILKKGGRSSLETKDGRGKRLEKVRE